MAVTIKDVAKAAGTSISTVSKVINGHYSISEATAERVRAVMRELGYYPSASAQSFARGSTRAVVCLAELRPNTAFENPHLFEMISGLEEGLRARGYSLTLRSTDTTEACEIATELINRRGCDGLAVHASVMSRPLAALLTRTRFPHIVLGLPNFESQVCWIDINNVFSGMTAAAHLLDEGYRRIAFIGGSEHDMISAHRLEGVRQGLESAGRELPELLEPEELPELEEPLWGRLLPGPSGQRQIEVIHERENAWNEIIAGAGHVGGPGLFCHSGCAVFWRPADHDAGVPI